LRIYRAAPSSQHTFGLQVHQCLCFQVSSLHACPPPRVLETMPKAVLLVLASVLLLLYLQPAVECPPPPGLLSVFQAWLIESVWSSVVCARQLVPLSVRRERSKIFSSASSVCGSLNFILPYSSCFSLRALKKISVLLLRFSHSMGCPASATVLPSARNFFFLLQHML
jgi:hypothetical protein